MQTCKVFLDCYLSASPENLVWEKTRNPIACMGHRMMWQTHLTECVELLLELLPLGRRLLVALRSDKLQHTGWTCELNGEKS